MLTIKPLHKKQLNFFLDSLAKENWHVESEHIQALFKTHPKDFFVATKKKEVIGFVLATRESKQLGFISSLLVLDAFRGNGYAKELFLFAMEHLQDRQVALNSVQDTIGLYESFGFSNYYDVTTYKFTTGLVQIKEQKYEVENFSKKLSLRGHTPYMKALLSSENLQYKAIIKNKSISSFAFCLPYHDGYKVVINAQDINEAITLFFALSKGMKSALSLYIEASKATPMVLAIVEYLKMQEYSRVARMYNKILL